MSVIDFGSWEPRFGIKSVATRKIFMGNELKWLEINVFDVEMSLVSGFIGDFLMVERTVSLGLTA